MKQALTGFIVALLLIFGLNAKSEGTYAVHPTPPPGPKYLSADRYDELKKALAPPPKPGSKEQQADEQTLRKLQTTRTAADCKRANSEVQFSFKGYFAEPDGPLTSDELKKAQPLLDQVFNDTLFFIDKLKLEYPRKRPYDYLGDIKPCVPLERTMAYPSGHTAISIVESKIAGDLFPQKAAKLQARAEQIANDRIVGGVHHPSDVEAGKKIAATLYPMFENSATYQSDLKKIKTQTVK